VAKAASVVSRTVNKGETMGQAIERLYKNITLTDVQLASAYYPILVDLARHKHCLTYSELVLLC